MEKENVKIIDKEKNTGFDGLIDSVMSKMGVDPKTKKEPIDWSKRSCNNCFLDNCIFSIILLWVSSEGYFHNSNVVCPFWQSKNIKKDKLEELR